MAELKQNIHRWVGKLEKFKYAFLVLLIGVVLMCVPFEIEAEKEDVYIETPQQELDLEKCLTQALALVEGVGEIEVLLSPETDTSHTYQVDLQTRNSSDLQEQQSETVLMSDGGKEIPLETAAAYPTYRGALIVCQGADKASVKLAVIQAVSDVTGLNSDHITVIKMKGK